MKRTYETCYGQCNHHCIFMTAKYFSTIDDFINLEMVVKRFRVKSSILTTIHKMIVIEFHFDVFLHQQFQEYPL